MLVLMDQSIPAVTASGGPRQPGLSFDLLEKKKRPASPSLAFPHLRVGRTSATAARSISWFAPSRFFCPGLARFFCCPAPCSKTLSAPGKRTDRSPGLYPSASLLSENLGFCALLEPVAKLVLRADDRALIPSLLVENIARIQGAVRKHACSPFERAPVQPVRAIFGSVDARLDRIHETPSGQKPRSFCDARLLPGPHQHDLSEEHRQRKSVSPQQTGTTHQRVRSIITTTLGEGGNHGAQRPERLNVVLLDVAPGSAAGPRNGAGHGPAHPARTIIGVSSIRPGLSATQHCPQQPP